MGLTGLRGLTVAISKYMIHHVISPDKYMLWLYNTFTLHFFQSSFYETS